MARMAYIPSDEVLGCSSKSFAFLGPPLGTIFTGLGVQNRMFWAVWDKFRLCVSCMSRSVCSLGTHLQSIDVVAFKME